jgi:hypothetical protein
VGAQVEPPSYRQLLEVQVADLESTVAGYEKTRRDLCEQLEIYKSGISPAAVAQAQHHLGLEAEAGACPPDMLSGVLAGMSPQARELIEHHHFIKQLDVYQRFPNQELQRLRAELSAAFPASRGVSQEVIQQAEPVRDAPYVAPSTEDPEMMLRLLGAPRARQEPAPPVVLHVAEMKHPWEVEDFNSKVRDAGATVTNSLVTFLIRVLAGTPITQEDLVWSGKRIHELKAYGTQDTKTQQLASEFVKLSAAHRVDTDIGRTVAEKQTKDRQAAAASKAAQAAAPGNRVLAVPEPKLRPRVADAVPLPGAVSPQSSPMVAAEPAIIVQPPRVANANDKKSRQLRNYRKAEASSGPRAVKALADFVAVNLKGKDPSSDVLWIHMEDQPGFKELRPSSLASDVQKLARLMVLVDMPSRKQTKVVASLLREPLDANRVKLWGEFYNRQSRFDDEKRRQGPVALAAVHALLTKSEAPHPALGEKYADLPSFAALDTNVQTLLNELDALTTLAYECGKAEVELEEITQTLELNLPLPNFLGRTAALAVKRSQHLVDSSREDHDWRAELFQEAAKTMERHLLGDPNSSWSAAPVRTVSGNNRAAIQQRLAKLEADAKGHPARSNKVRAESPTYGAELSMQVLTIGKETLNAGDHSCWERAQQNVLFPSLLPHEKRRLELFLTLHEMDKIHEANQREIITLKRQLEEKS